MAPRCICCCKFWNFTVKSRPKEICQTWGHKTKWREIERTSKPIRKNGQCPLKWQFSQSNIDWIRNLHYSMQTFLLFMYLNLQISSKKSSAMSLQFFIWEILITILRSLRLYLTSESRVFSFCSAFRGDLTVIVTSSKQGIRNFESSWKRKNKKLQSI